MRHRRTRALLASASLLVSLLLPLLCACAGDRPVDRVESRDELGGRLQAAALPSSWPKGATLHLRSWSRELPAEWRQAEYLLSLRRHVSEGGGLLLEGQAVQLAAALGLCSPSALRPRSLTHGYDGHSDARGLRFGLYGTELGRELLGMEEEPRWLDEGRLLHAELVGLDPSLLGTGASFAHLITEKAAQRRVRADSLVAGWEIGNGRILCVGVVAEEAEAQHAELQRYLDTRALPWLAKSGAAIVTIEGNERRPEVDGWARAPKIERRAAYWEDPLPAARPWQLGVCLPGAMATAHPVDELVRTLSAQQVDLLVLRVRSLERQFDARKDVRWRREPDQVPESRLLEIARAAHAAGMQCALELPDKLEPLGRGEARLSFADALASRLFDEARLGEAGFDGVFVRGLDAWALRGFVEELRERRPSVFVVASDPFPVPGDGIIGQIDSCSGKFAGLPIAGLDEAGLMRGQRPGVSGILRLETRVSRGATPDWLRTQCKDFVRLYGDAAQGIVLDLHDAEQLDRLGELCAWAWDPGRDAAVFALSSTGQLGARDALRQLVPARELAPSSPVSARQTVCENAWLRLETGGGRLLYDPTRSARFQQGAVVLSPAFDTSRILGARPGADYLLAYAREFDTGARSSTASRELIVGQGDFDWPGALRASGVQTLRQLLVLPPGRYRMQIEGQSSEGGALVELSLDHKILGYFAGAGESSTHSFEFGIAEKRVHELVLRLRHGASVELLHARIDRIGDVGIERRSRARAGELVDHVEFVNTSFVREERRVRMLSGLPGILVSVLYREGQNGLRVDREYPLPEYRLIRAAKSQGRAPWILAGRRPGLPTLWIYELDQGPKHRSTWVPGTGLRIHNLPRSHTGFRLAILLADELGPSADPIRLLPHLRALYSPPQLKLVGGEARIPAPLPHPWPRLVLAPETALDGLCVRDPRGEHALRFQAQSDGELACVLTHVPGRIVQIGTGDVRLPRVGVGMKRILSVQDMDESQIVVLRRACTATSLRAFLHFEVDATTLRWAGQDWLYRDARRVALPWQTGALSFEIASAAFAGPHVLDSSAGLLGCSLRDGNLCLSVQTAAEQDYPSSQLLRLRAWEGSLGGRLRVLDDPGSSARSTQAPFVDSQLLRGHRGDWTLPRSARPATPQR
jgi:hypothetical protein